MKVTLEPVQWILRIHPDFENNPDKYIGSASVSLDIDNVASIRALVSSRYTEKISTEIKRALAEDIGATKIIWGRRKSGRRYAGSKVLLEEQVNDIT